MSWHPEVTEFLTTQNYQEIINFYEAEINKEPDNISLYWYLGLAYLLSGQSTEASGIWLSVFSQGDQDELDIWTQELVTILDKEASRQFSLENYQFSWLIRQQIIDLLPDSVNNLLHIINLSIIFNTYQPRMLKDSQLIELIKNSNPESLDNNLLVEVLKKTLTFANTSSLEFAEAALKYYPDKSQLIAIINGIANEMIYKEKYPVYAADLNKLFLEYEPDNLLYYKQIFWYYIYIGDTQEALKIAKDFEEKADTILLKLFASYLLLHVLIMDANWTEAIIIVENHKELVRLMTSEKPLIVPNFLKFDFIVVGCSLFYIEDNPRENRPLINEISRLFQNTTRKVIPEPDLLMEVDRQPHQRLRIGYIGHTLREHSVGWLSRWLFHYHDRQQFEIYIYLLNQSEEEFTKTWFTSKVDKLYCFYRDTIALTKQVKNDQIDILVDLDSLTFNLTCQVMTFKPAPIQVTWLGLDASGIPAIDYFIADPYVLPDNAQDYYRETIWRLPQTYLGVDGFEMGIPNLRREDLDIPPDAVIYLNIQNSSKRHPHTLDLQMEIIKAVPNSYFLNKGTGDIAIIKKVFTESALRHGVSPERLRFLPRTPDEQTHRANLAIADIVLDTYPYNGATTTLEVLWMGIPLVTRVGEQFASRNSYAFMKQVGLTEGIAWSDAEYVDWGIKLGENPQLRQQITWKLRQSRQTSPLWNGQKFTRDMEQAYQQMWSKYLEQKEC